ncbi:MAG: D-alanine--D-alanine ligase [Pseudobutyrivibrio sp.]|nr:D-alanine--D-alanine ligase [Pseudobutyrivibrio sp.]
MNIVVLAGGLSSERDVSFKSGQMVAQALRTKGHNALVLDVFMGYSTAECDISDIFDKSIEYSVDVSAIPTEAPDIEAVKSQRKDKSKSFFGPNVIRICQAADVVFMALHGSDGENGKVQAAFDLYGIKYTGNDYLSSAITMDKGLTKVFFELNNIPTPQGITMSKTSRYGYSADIKLPCVVKPTCGGSSIGVSIVRDKESFEAALDAAFMWENEVVIEEFVEGREFSDGVIELSALPVIEIAPKVGFYDYKNKYAAGSAVETCPADIPADIAEKIQEYAVRICKALGMTTYARMDFILSNDGKIYCLEVNTLPGMTPTSLLPQEAAAIGIDFPSLCEKIIYSSLKKYE